MGDADRRPGERAMQRSLIVAIIVGAGLIAAGLVYHGRQLARLSERLRSMEQRTGELDGRIDAFSRDLPSIVARAGEDAGRQAVDGVFGELYRQTVGRLRQIPIPGAPSNRTVRTPESRGAGFLPVEEGGPLVRFSIPDTVFNVEILPNLKELPPLPWFAPVTNPPTAARPNLPPAERPATRRNRQR